jgi:hypothetical protein
VAPVSPWYAATEILGPLVKLTTCAHICAPEGDVIGFRAPSWKGDPGSCFPVHHSGQSLSFILPPFRFL